MHHITVEFFVIFDMQHCVVAICLACFIFCCSAQHIHTPVIHVYVVLHLPCLRLSMYCRTWPRSTNGSCTSCETSWNRNRFWSRTSCSTFRDRPSCKRNNSVSLTNRYSRFYLLTALEFVLVSILSIGFGYSRYSAGFHLIHGLWFVQDMLYWFILSARTSRGLFDTHMTCL